MSDAGKRILDGLKDAVAGNFSRVTIDGQTWVRADSSPSTFSEGIEAAAKVADEAASFTDKLGADQDDVDKRNVAFGAASIAKDIANNIRSLLPTTGERGSVVAWRPIETAEKDGEARLLWDDFKQLAVFGFWGYAGVNEPDSEHTWRDSVRWRPFKPTHWMPSPRRPADLSAGDHLLPGAGR